MGRFWYSKILYRILCSPIQTGIARKCKTGTNGRLSDTSYGSKRPAPKPAKAATNKRQCAVDDNHEDATSSSSRDPKMCVLHALHGGRSCLPRQETQETISQPITSRTADHKSYSRTVERFNQEQCAPCTTRSTSQISTPNPSRLRTDPHDNNNQPQTNPRKYSRILQVQGHQKIVL